MRVAHRVRLVRLGESPCEVFIPRDAPSVQARRWIRWEEVGLFARMRARGAAASGKLAECASPDAIVFHLPDHPQAHFILHDALRAHRDVASKKPSRPA